MIPSRIGTKGITVPLENQQNYWVLTLIEYDDSTSPWTELSRRLMLEISKEGVRWYLPDSAISNS
jgi:hypothetical protein